MKKIPLLAFCVLAQTILAGCGASSSGTGKPPEPPAGPARRAPEDKTKLKGYKQLDDIYSAMHYVDELEKAKADPAVIRSFQARPDSISNDLKRMGLTPADIAKLQKYWDFDSDFKNVKKKQ